MAMLVHGLKRLRFHDYSAHIDLDEHQFLLGAPAPHTTTETAEEYEFDHVYFLR